MILLFIRTVFSYIFVVLALRVTGKRQIGELQPSELVVTLMISNIAALPLQETGMPLLSSLLPIATLILLELGLSGLMLKFRAIRRLISGRSIIVIRNGKIIESNLRKIRLTVDELCEELRLTGNFNVDEIVCCMVETNGKLSILKKFEYDPVTPKALDLPPQDNAMTFVIISDGNIDKTTLKLCGFNQNWLDNTLKQEKINYKDVLLMTADHTGKYNILRKKK